MLEPPSPARDLARLLLAKRIFGNDPALARFERKAPVDDAVQRAAQAQAADWHLRHFKGATAKLSDHTAGLSPRFDTYCEIEGGDCGWPSPTAHAVPDCVVGAP
jgi:hypothetical protein